MSVNDPHSDIEKTFSRRHAGADEPTLIAVLETKNDFFPRDCPIRVRTLNLYPYQPRRRGGRPRNSLRELQWCRAKAGAASASRRGEHGKIRGKARQI